MIEKWKKKAFRERNDAEKNTSVDGADWKSLFERIGMGRRVVGEWMNMECR